MEQVTELKPSPYQVFINHRGIDTKKSLASLIYHRLTSYGFHVFLDTNELQVGDALPPQIWGAIRSAPVHIVIFSKHYAESRWCLDELVAILTLFHNQESNLIPLFCDVEPTDLRHIENGCYAPAFENHKRKGRDAMENIEKWKTALRNASYISGLIFKTDESDIDELVEEIVKTVLKKVRLSGYWEGIEKNVSKEVRPEQLKGIEKKLLKEARPGQWENVLKEIRPEQLEVATQVFITYSVPDIKNTLASLVYYRLANCYGLRVFMDDEENRTEDSPSPAILTAIHSASVHIVFFSENYAESLRFLDELCWVLGSSHPCTLIPVFCDVEPDDLRPIDGAFRTHEPKGQVAMEVKEALKKAAATPGHLFKTKESDSGEFLEKIEKNVLEELRWEPLQVAPHVFINHRGPEIKMTLASLIYNRLKICGFRGFHEKKETADTVSPAILSAIRSAPLHITIFSKGYAESRRCLDELSSILRSCHENGSLIIPVFCGVKPDDLLNIDGGCYAQAFNQHQREGGVSMEVAEGWKMALREASKISGLLFQTNER